jgi:hypothetical protein
MVPWEKTVLSQTPSGHAAVAGRSREESEDLRSMRMWAFSYRGCSRSGRRSAHPSPGGGAAGMDGLPVLYLHAVYDLNGRESFAD